MPYLPCTQACLFLHCRDLATGMAQDILVDHTQSFSSLSHVLDARILRALAEQGFARPTLVQAKAIPLALEGLDILARARTGSGKTAAYCIPLVQKILNVKSVGLPVEWLFVCR